MRINLFAQDVRDLRQTARRMRDTLVSSILHVAYHPANHLNLSQAALTACERFFFALQQTGVALAQ